ncbi:unnamed protein product [Gordionus sp. m RMFG-2023]|uniref:rab-like protein 6 n=1 Tax=Gordionus sp. m RMFG-2023 TaxID=3053472 RepID=UPI0030E0F51F
MLGAFKKLVVAQNSPTLKSPSPKSVGNGANIQTMGPSLQQKYSRGVHYNMKILVKGDRNVGKSCLYYRLQGKNFIEQYTPTSEIQIVNINWNYKNTENIVKVEIWDVVDKGKKLNATFNHTQKCSLKLQNDNIPDKLLNGEATLDAELIDVYKGAQGVIIMLDITRKWTLNYMKNELDKIPFAIPILILANKKDLQHKRAIDFEEITSYIRERQNVSSHLASTHIKVIESSMKNNFGLKYIHKFFNLPFLELQRDTLLRQLATNSENIQIILEELKFHAQSYEQNYDTYIDRIKGSKNISYTNDTKDANEINSMEISSQNNHNILIDKDNHANNVNKISFASVLQDPTLAASSSISPDSPKVQSKAIKTQLLSTDQVRTSLIDEKVNSNPSQDTHNIKSINSYTSNPLDNFIPAENIDYSFFESDNLQINDHKASHKIRIDDDFATDDDTDNISLDPNPMVMIYQEDLDD